MERALEPGASVTMESKVKGQVYLVMGISLVPEKWGVSWKTMKPHAPNAFDDNIENDLSLFLVVDVLFILPSGG